MKTFLALSLGLFCAAAARAEQSGATPTAHDLAEQCDREIAGVWDGMSKGLDALKSARRASDVNNLFAVARNSTNGLARISAQIDSFQSRLSEIITNEIDHQPLERTVKQELRGYVENDLQTLQTVKAIAAEDGDAISELIAQHEKEWTAMMDVLRRLYPESECMDIMQRRFNAAADDLRAKIESHRAVASAEPTPVQEPAVAETPTPPKRANPPPGMVMTAAPRDSASPSKWNETDTDYLSLSEATRHITVMASLGYSESELKRSIAASGPFLLTASQIIFLKDSGFSDPLIQSMLKRDRSLRHRR